MESSKTKNASAERPRKMIRSQLAHPVEPQRLRIWRQQLLQRIGPSDLTCGGPQQEGQLPTVPQVHKSTITC